MPAMFSPLMSIAAIASAITDACDDHISCGLCSTHPGLGNSWVNSRCATDRISPLRSNTIAPGTARSLIQCQNVLFHMLVFLCCFLRPARRFYPLRLQIYQKIPGFETKPQSFFSKPSLALHTGVGLTAPGAKVARSTVRPSSVARHALCLRTLHAGSIAPNGCRNG